MKVAIAGFGTIGRALARGIQGRLPDPEFMARAGGDAAETREAAARLTHPVPTMDSAELRRAADVFAECVPAAAFRAVAGSAF